MNCFALIIAPFLGITAVLPKNKKGNTLYYKVLPLYFGSGLPKSGIARLFPQGG
jgi:hypothetical protein